VSRFVWTFACSAEDPVPGDVLIDLVVVLVVDLDGDGNVELVGER
jgi:hypothetical protein